MLLESSQGVLTGHFWTVMIHLQDGALDLLRELRNMKMSLEMLQVIDSTASGAQPLQL